MKRKLSLILATGLLACTLTACANTVTGPDRAPGYDNTYRGYGYGYNYVPRGNVSTTPNGRVNGTNRPMTETTTSRPAAGTNRGTTGTNRTTTGTNRTTTGTSRTTTGTTGRTASAYNDAMGAGTRG